MSSEFNFIKLTKSTATCTRLSMNACADFPALLPILVYSTWGVSEYFNLTQVVKTDTDVRRPRWFSHRAALRR